MLKKNRWMSLRHHNAHSWHSFSTCLFLLLLQLLLFQQ
jgi:hypothetical protein